MRPVAWCERCHRVMYAISEVAPRHLCANPSCGGAVRYVGIDYIALTEEER